MLVQVWYCQKSTLVLPNRTDQWSVQEPVYYQMKTLELERVNQTNLPYWVLEHQMLRLMYHQIQQQGRPTQRCQILPVLERVSQITHQMVRVPRSHHP